MNSISGSIKSGGLADWQIPHFDLSDPAPVGLSADAFDDLDMDYAVVRLGGRFHLSFGDVASFHVCFEAKTIELAAASELCSAATLDHLLYDHVIPRIIAANGHLVLHGSAVAIAGKLAIFIGETGAGKSTLSASLHRSGHQLLGDDAVIITEADGCFFGEAVYPSLRLYPETIEQVFGTDARTAPMAHYSDKRHVTDFGRVPKESQRLPVARIFALAHSDDAPRLQSLTPREACMAMIEQSFAFDPSDISAAARRMQQASRLAAAVPTQTLAYPHDFAVLQQVHRLIEATLAAPSDAASPEHSSESPT